ncbi:broad specificity phosphatase PhoE [Rhodoligotrophos appendicifer]|uniref:histidine phosphatase family protein n=1 Tax=Rhodoligotrophos appendicifer TaxID=987056 RepID=UPI00117F72E8|nr:histidine phosphatase family protein [Rhodoligotrophos appendicifer]
MSARLTFICQGTTAAVKSSAFPNDEPLEVRAMEAAGVLGKEPLRATVAYRSPAVAALQTSEALSLDALPVDDLRDCDYGRWAGRKLADLHTEDPVALEKWLRDMNAAPHGGESLSAVCLRVSAWLKTLVSRRERIVAITHSAVMRAAVLDVLNAPSKAFWHIDIEPLGVIEFRSDGRRWHFRAGNLR